MKVTKAVGRLLISLKIAAFYIVLSKHACPFFIGFHPAPASSGVLPGHRGKARALFLSCCAQAVRIATQRCSFAFTLSF